TSPLLEDISIDGSRGILINVTASPDFGVEELNEACNYIKERAHEDVNLIFGLVFDETMRDSVRITVIATGIQSPKVTSIERVTPKLSTATANEGIGDEFDIPAFIRKRQGIKEGK
ncbi:MAG TPA: cell division protein FtsZ, partial [Thermodesulfobacteriota bacterium]|nr:cell division protein FtsZ [Thermodesulfobacteriota bacterium]